MQRRIISHYQLCEGSFHIEQAYTILIMILLLILNATQSVGLIHNLERLFACTVIFCFEHPLASCITPLIVFIWRLTQTEAGFN